MKQATQSALLAAIGEHFLDHDAAPVTLTIGQKLGGHYIEVTDAPHSVIASVFTWLKDHKDEYFATAHLRNGKLHIS